MTTPPVVPGGPPADQLVEYRRLVARLAATVERRATDTEQAERSYATAVATAGAELAALVETADVAERRAARAATAVVATDQEADRLWSRLRRALGWRGVLLGDVPAPVDADQPPDGDRRAERLLANAAGRIDGLRAPTRAASPGATVAVRALALLGGAAAAIAVLLVAGWAVSLALR